jgi:trimeric autotransporter adhesin
LTLGTSSDYISYNGSNLLLNSTVPASTNTAWYFNDATNSTSPNSGSVVVTGSIGLGGKLSFQNYNISSSSNALNFNTTNGSDVQYNLYTFNGNGTQANKMSFYSSGTAVLTDNEYLSFGYDSSAISYDISSLSNGTGSRHPITINSTQTVYNTDGTVSYGNTNASTSSSSAAVMAYSVSLANTTDSSSSSSGGSLTTAGGIAVAKKIYTGTGINVATGGVTVSAGGVTVSAGGVTVSAGGLNITGTSTFNNSITIAANLTLSLSTSLLSLTGTTSRIVISGSTDATSSLSGGSFTTAGGMAIAKSLYIGTTMSVTGSSTFVSTINGSLTTASTNSSTGSLLLSGGLAISNTTDASNSTNGGSFTTAGGMAIAKSLYIGSNLIATGSAVFNNTSTVSGSFKINGVGSTTSSNSTLYSNPSSTDLAGSSSYYFNYFNSPTTAVPVSFSGIASTVYIAGAPTITTGGVSYALNISSGSSIFGGNVNILGITTSTNTTVSTSSAGSIITSGGITSTNTTDATSSSSGGSFTVTGGAAVSKKLFAGSDVTLTSTSGIFNISGSSVDRFKVDSTTTTISPLGTTITATFAGTSNTFSTDLVLSSTANSSSNSTGSLQIAGGAYITKNLLANSSIIFTSGSQNYNIVPSSADLSLSSSSSSFNLDISNGTNDGLSDSLVSTYSEGYGTSDSSKLIVGFSNLSYIIKPTITGTGTEYPLALGISNQMLLRTDGTILLNTSGNSTNSSTGTFNVSGSISISNTTDSVSTSNGGSFTTAGGMAIGKTIYTKNLSVSGTTVSTSYDNGSVILSGSLALPSIMLGSSSTQNYFIDTSSDSISIITSGTATGTSTLKLSGTNSNIKLFSLGSSTSDTDNEYLYSGYDGTKYLISANSAGTGITNPIHISSGTSTLIIGNNGQTTSSSTQVASNSSTASFVVSGGLSVSSTTNASSTSSTSAVNIGGGVIVAKDTFTGGDIILSSISPKLKISSTSAGMTALSHSMTGLELISSDNDLSNAYFPGLKFLSQSSSFSTTNPKMVALIAAKASENYLADTAGGSDLEFYSASNALGTSALPSLRLCLKNTGQVVIPGTLSSTSTLTGTILTSGGITSSNTTDSTSETNGGSLTLGGGAAIAKSVHIGGYLHITQTDTATGGFNGALQVTGGAYIGKDLRVNNSISTDAPTQTYSLTSRTTADSSLLLKSSGSNTDFKFEIVTEDQDGTDNIDFSIYAKGGSQLTNYERMSMSYSNIDSKFRIGTANKGTGSIRDLIIYTGSNSTQLVLNNSDGSISMGSTVTSVSSTTGALKISGGLGISTTVDASSSTVGGALTVGGGAAISGKLFVGGITTISNTTASTSFSSGSVVISGGLGVATNIYTGGKLQIKVADTNAFSVLTSGSSNIFSVDTTSSQFNTTCETVVTSTINSTSSTTGSIHTLGGVGITKDLIIGGKLVMNGTSPIDMTNNYINNLHDPIASSDAATKAYVDSVASGFIAKASCEAATTTSGTLASSFQAGNIIDAYTLVLGDRILIKNQASAIENGIYTVNVSGAPTRASDLNTSSNASGALVFINGGTVNSGTSWQCATTGTVIVGTDPINFTQYSSNTLTAGDGLAKTGNILSVNVDTTTIEIFSDTLRIGSGAAGTGLSGGGGTALSVNASQTQITALGTIGTGVWQGTAITVPYGGTGASTFTTGRVLFGDGSNPLSTSSNLFWDNTNGSLGIGTSSPDPTAEGDGITLLDKDISLKTSNNTTGLSSLLFQNSSSNYNWRIYRSDAGSGNAHLIFSTGNGSKTALTSTVLGLSASGNVSVGLAPSLNTDKFYVNGNSNLNGNVTISGTINAGNSVPVVNTFTSLINIASGPSAVNSKMNLNGSEVHLWVTFSVTPTATHSNTEFQFNLPNISTDIGANRYYVSAQLNGWTDDTNLTVLQNILCTGVASSNKAIVKFQSASTSVHLVQIYLRYTAN